MNIELSSIPSPVYSGKGSDLEETDPVRADNFYTNREIEVAEALYLQLQILPKVQHLLIPLIKTVISLSSLGVELQVLV